MTTTYTPAQARQFAVNAGFTGNSVNIIAAIAQAESGLRDTPPDNINNDGLATHDRGILQFNSYWHSEVSNTCAYAPQCAFNEAYRVTLKGTKFTEWSTYNNGDYLKYLTGGNVLPPPTISTGVSGAVQTVVDNVHMTLNSVPGFVGIVEALDEIEQFQPLTLKGVSGDLKLFGIDTGIPNLQNLDISSDGMQSVLMFIAVNTRAFGIRALLILIGVIIVIGLIMNAIDT